MSYNGVNESYEWLLICIDLKLSCYTHLTRTCTFHSLEHWPVRSTMMTSSNGNNFQVTGTLCGEFPAQRPVTWSFGVFFYLRLSKRSSKHLWCWWSETSSRPLWRHCNANISRTPKNQVTEMHRSMCGKISWEFIDFTVPTHERHCVSNHQQIDCFWQFVPANKQNIKAPYWWSFVGGIIHGKNPLMDFPYEGAVMIVHYFSRFTCPHYWPSVSGIHRDRWIPLTKGQ